MKMIIIIIIIIIKNIKKSASSVISFSCFEILPQRITASDMPGGESLRSFGYSLSGGLDLDANGYPDLLVGSYESGTISLLRSRAIIRLQADIRVTPNKTDLGAPALCPFDNSQHRCVEMEICLTFTAEPADR